MKNKKSPQSTKLKAGNLYEIHSNYWTFRQEEKNELIKRYPDQLNEKEKLRLIHQIFLEIFSSKSKSPLNDIDLDAELPLDDELKKICTQIISGFMKPESAFRPKYCVAWKGSPETSENREPDVSGNFINMSLTHLGCVEVINVDNANNPLEVDFIPFDEIMQIILSRPAMFRVAKIIFEGNREAALVYLPTVYGLSWFSKNETDYNGSLTKFFYSLNFNDHPFLSLGIGQQDFLVKEEKKHQIIGLNSIGSIATVLEPYDPKFEEKCRARGVDPEKLLRKK